MKSYKHDTVFTFGRYEGQMLIDILKNNPTYLDWCIQKLDHFCIYLEDIEYIKSIIPDLNISEEALSLLNTKNKICQEEEKERLKQNELREQKKQEQI